MALFGNGNQPNPGWWEAMRQIRRRAGKVIPVFANAVLQAKPWYGRQRTRREESYPVL
jgi:hypothetical protein